MIHTLANRFVAGKLLAEKLAHYQARPNTLVIALPRGGVPVGFEIAKALRLPLDILLVRKLGTPQSKELAMGAIASENIQVMNLELIKQLHISDAQVEQVIVAEQKELKRREELYRGDKAALDLKNKEVILVDDGIATGSTIKAGIMAITRQKPERLIVASPIIALPTSEQLKAVVVEVVALIEPENLTSVGMWYGNFDQISDQQVSQLLAEAVNFGLPTNPN